MQTRVLGICVLNATILLAAGALPTPAAATEMMPNYATVPTGWTVDRYDPAGFANVGPYENRTDVLGITINASGSVANRGPSYSASFYNTQGRGFDLGGGAGSTLTADLFVPTSWGDALNGSRRTDMWGVMSDGTDVTDYPIIGFTNYGGAPRFRVFDGDVPGGWVDLVNGVNYDDWNTLQIAFTGDSYVYSVNWTVAYVDTTANGSTNLDRVLMQAYNFGDPSVSGAVVNDYTAHWSVPEPASAVLLLTGLLGMNAIRRRTRRAR